MQHKLISLNTDLKRLWVEGLELEVKGNYLLVNHIPYLNSLKEVKYGILVTTLNLSGESLLKPDTHVVYFIGEYPRDKNGNVISALQHSSGKQNLGFDIIVEHSFSNKPTNDFQNYYDKIYSYIRIISNPAKAIDESVTEKTFNQVLLEESESVLKYSDTNSTRAKLDYLSLKLKDMKIGIIGLGGTGSYILDFISKCLVREIHLYDGDRFLQHNSFRSPGAAELSTIQNEMPKVDYYKGMYSKMHNGIVSHNLLIDSSNVELLLNLDFIFISIDKGTAKRQIVEYLTNKNIQFIDVGMGIEKADDNLTGLIRVTTSTKNKIYDVSNGNKISFCDNGSNEYNNNIQIAELNALNAAMAVIKWKKIFGIYHDVDKECFSVYSINENKIYSDDYET